jgi:hypothetical protein
MGRGESATVIPEKYFTSRFRADQFRAGCIEVPLKGFLSGRAEKNETLLISFSNDTCATSRKVELFDSEG